MTITKADILLNDQEINLLADLFLARYGFDRASLSYRLIRNTVILISHGAWDIQEVHELVARCADIEIERAIAEIQSAVKSLKTPMHETYNTYYAPPPIEYELRGESIKMPEFGKVDDTLQFLGTAFLYLILTNYNKYEYIDYQPEK
ncbi:MAG: hypothetical protein J1F39_03770 [Clostridiales bacterium]|nr:hypothetical protein [Clostridiales bacterium]